MFHLRCYSTLKRKTIGFIGLGQMGYPMASNLIKKFQPEGFIVHDYNKNQALNFQKEHKEAQVVDSPLEVAKRCQVIITMLPTGKHVRSVYTGENGLLQGLQPGSLVLDSSTIEPTTSKDLSSILKGKDVNMLDTPVSGGTLGAQAGTLTFMVGADSPELFEKSKEVLQHMGKNLVFCGTVGNGQIAKICNNMMLGISMIAASETMNLGVQMGMDPKLLAGILNTSTGRCWSTEVYNPCPGVLPNVPSSRGYTGGFGVSLMAKDMGLAVNIADQSKAPVTLGAVAHQIFNKVMTTKGYEDKDFSSVYKWLNSK
jgi:3-hydroxyisobutyrate dehydrogenase